MSEKDILNGLRKDILLTAIAGGGGHLASSYSALEILYALYGRGVLRVDPKDPRMADRDRFILSKGHAALACYAVLAREGFFPRDMLEGYAKPGSMLGGEPSGMDIPGVETPTGSLGHGLCFGVGTALGAKLDNGAARTFVLLGDGECQEGSVWEAAATAAALKLDNLTVIVDANGIQKMARIEDVEGATDGAARWRSFGWDVAAVDGHDVDALCAALNAPRLGTGKPLAVLARTIKGKGVSVMENDPAWHYRLPGKKELKAFMAELGVTQEEVAHAKGLYQRAE